MTLLEALKIVRANVQPTPPGAAMDAYVAGLKMGQALKRIDEKIAALERKAAWRRGERPTS